MDIDTHDPRPVAQHTMAPEEERAKEYDFLWHVVVPSDQFWNALQQELDAQDAIRETG